MPVSGSSSVPGPPWFFFVRGDKKPININNFSGLSREWVGVKIINKIPRRSQESAGTVPGQSRDNPVKVFLCVLLFIDFFLAPIFVCSRASIVLRIKLLEIANKKSLRGAFDMLIG